MKKLLALFLAALMLTLPMAAMAETIAFSVTLDVAEGAVDDTALTESLQALTGLNGKAAETLSAAVFKLLDGCGIQAAWQEDAVRLGLQFGGTELLDLTAVSRRETLYLASSLFPRHTITMEAAPDAQPVQIDVDGVADEIRDGVTAWLTEQRHSTSNGSFSGDAYDDGVSCTTWNLDSDAIAALASRVLQGEKVNAQLTAVFGAKTVANWQKEIAGGADQHTYTLRIVRDENEAVIGLSVIVLRGAQQIATLSAGMEGEHIKLVIGLGLKEQNYWFNLEGMLQKQDDVWHLQGITHEWLAPRDETYGYAAATGTPVSAFTLQGHWNRCTPDAALTIRNEALTLHAALAAAQEIDTGYVDSLTPCAIENLTDPAYYAEIVNGAVQRLAIRLMKILPAEVLELLPADLFGE